MGSAPRRSSAPTYVAIGAATGAAHIGNNFTTYLVGGLIDRFGFSPIQMGGWSMAETLAYAGAMFLVAPRAYGLGPRSLGLAATLLIVTAQLLSALLSSYPLLLAGRIATGLGFGLMNSAVNLAAGQTSHPARAISAGIAVQTLLFAAVNIGLPMIGTRYGVDGMFVGLATLSALLGVGTLLMPDAVSGAKDPVVGIRIRIGADGGRVLLAMALFAFGSLAIWPFVERAARAIAISAIEFGRYQSVATLLSAVGNLAMVAVAARLPRALPLSIALIVCGGACALLTTAPSAPFFAAALIFYNVSWFIVYPLLLGLAFAVEPGGRLAVMTSGVWLLSQSLGALGAGMIAQFLGGYWPLGPLGLIACIAAIVVAWPLARKLDSAADSSAISAAPAVTAD
ncbi:MFS transporter [Sphingomonas oleivorans]|uniref:MFS transporter n=1 Tax=Sphingomonas oleivorans TaxID=1735121 RepID=A0A2T5G0R4_9SPHN|nr:MFS transporter [Sphingomonas oleivorans]PTQ12737.1 MFS transporter [Sphingomonas oleivorans]